MVWLRDSTQSFVSGFYDQIIMKNNLIYLKGQGIAVFSLNGDEKWSKHVGARRMAVDNKGQMIVSAVDTTTNTIYRFDSTGTLNFSDSTINAERIATDMDNNFYLLGYISQYAVVKYDSAGNFKWQRTNLPFQPGFGDIGYDVLVDYESNVILTGLNDTMFKFSSAGALIWRKSMHGLDSYMTSAEITFSNLIAIAGSVYAGNDYSLKVATFDRNGNQNWSGTYNAAIGKQEFAVSATIDNSGVYVAENNNQNTTLVKFAPFFTTPVNYAFVCVDSVWYDSGGHFINVRLFNGNASYINYPSVQIITPQGDTIGNPKNIVNFFIHMGNTYQTYHDTIKISGIANWSSYTFLVNEGFGSTKGIIAMCGFTGVYPDLKMRDKVILFPNPFEDGFAIYTGRATPMQFQLFDISGRLLLEKEIVNRDSVPAADLAKGIYFYRLKDENGFVQSGKLIAH